MRPYRIEKVASLVREIVSEAIATRLSDPRISSLTSVTRVEVSGDLQFADVYISVVGTEAEQRRTMAGLQHAAGRIQSLLARQIRMRQCPRLRFVPDYSIKRGMETIRLINETMARTRTRQGQEDMDEQAQPDGQAGGDPGEDE